LVARILLTSSYPEFTTMSEDIAKELDMEIIIVEAVLEDAAEQVAEICNQRDIAVIVSRGGTTQAIEQVVDIPLIAAEASDFDILKALWEAKKYSDRVGFLGFDYPEMPYDFQMLLDIIGIQVKQFLYKNTSDIIKQVDDAVNQQYEVMVGGGIFGVNLARQRGINGILVRSSRRTAIQALQRAKWALEVRDRDKKSAKQLQTILNFSHEGIATLDQDEVIRFFNPGAENILGLDKSEVINQPVDRWKKNQDLIKVFHSGKETRRAVVTVGDTSLIVNRAPITVDKQNFGTVITFQEVSKLQQLEYSVRRQMHNRGLVAKFGLADIKTESQPVIKSIQRAKQFGVTDSTILITGESGTGKEMFAQGIHNISGRKEGPFVAVNCAALPENLLESELFGYEEGAFTGAKKGGKPGYFELAHGGTIFLDEIGTLPKNVQSRLLRVLQEKEVFRLGGDKVVPVDVRVIAATNEDLRSAVAEKKFRTDLYYRLNVLYIKLPPLRERINDIPLLANHFLEMYNQRFGKQVKIIEPELLTWLCEYSWPGNIRELNNYLERLIILAEGDTLSMDLLDLEQVTEAEERAREKNSFTVAPGTLDEIEDQVIDILVDRFNGNKGKIADALGISRTTLWKKLKRMGHD